MNLSESWYLHVDPDVFKALKRFPARDIGAILEVLRLLPNDPYFGDLQKMKGDNNVWRRRVGAYRIFYSIKNLERIILVFRVERRSSKTY